MGNELMSTNRWHYALQRSQMELCNIPKVTYYKTQYKFALGATMIFSSALTSRQVEWI